MQEALMKYSPDTGEERPYPSNAKQWREYHGRVAWLYNPWTGEKRDPKDVGSDVYGSLLYDGVGGEKESFTLISCDPDFVEKLRNKLKEMKASGSLDTSLAPCTHKMTHVDSVPRKSPFADLPRNFVSVQRHPSISQ